MTRKYVLIAAYTSDGTLLDGFPGVNKYEGPYISKFPSPAASKAYTQVIQFIDAHKQWPQYRNIDLNSKLELIIIMQEMIYPNESSDESSGESSDDSSDESDDGPKFGKTFNYLVWREPAPQGKRSIENSSGRIRQYQWKNRAIPINENSSIDEAKSQYFNRSKIARNKAITTGNLK
jgi:hypothetical protein